MTTKYEITTLEQNIEGDTSREDADLRNHLNDGWEILNLTVTPKTYTYGDSDQFSASTITRYVTLKRESKQPAPAPEPTDDEILEWRLIRAWALTSMPPVGKNGLWMLSLAAKYEQKLIDALPQTDLNVALEDPRGPAPAPTLPVDVIAAHAELADVLADTWSMEELYDAAEALSKALRKHIPADSESDK